MTGIEVVLGVLGGIVLFSLAVMVTFVLIVRAAVRRVRRNRAVSGAALRARAKVSRGAQRPVLALRVRLDEALRSGGAAVELVAGGGGSRGELPRLFGRIADEGGVLDLQLRLMESEHDTAVLAEELPAARHRVDQVEQLVRHVRSAVASGLSGTTDDTLAVLRSDVDREVAALHAGIEELQALNRRDGRFAAPSPQASTVRDEGNRP
ncbi:hypothetical protein [Agromyces sp. Leaf222]|uniref:hypothetical protein n=1 Tax=Agromyces sp. Leaf222 TaxID=1735688 RepID=UPI00070132FB|nr:hypothetical protein [Agromyces sp. Leaf222]KQM82472.1 hypothetical protein ASE68_03570 [Agromyces sp. Leaf222]